MSGLTREGGVVLQYGVIGKTWHLKTKSEEVKKGEIMVSASWDSISSIRRISSKDEEFDVNKMDA